jgi:hypothetical protein
VSALHGALFVAHGIGGIKDLPVPTYLFYWGAAIVLVVSFVALGVLWPRPLLGPRANGRVVSSGLSRAVLSTALRIALGSMSVVVFLVIVVSALFGETEDVNYNFAPTFVYVVFWLGLPLLSAVLGDVWRVLSPWRAIADAYVWLWERGGGQALPLGVYPERLGRWPGAVAYFAFTALELASTDPSNPRQLAIAVLVYTSWALFGMAIFGRDTWTRTGEGFAVAFSYLARLSPFVVRAGRLRMRIPLTGLIGDERRPGALAFVAVMLGSVGFDGFSRTTTWQNVLADVQIPYALSNPTLADRLTVAVNLGGLVVAVLFVAGAYRGACALARYGTRSPRSLAPEFVLSLVPIAFVYAVAHYFSLAVLQSQFVPRLLSDPLGRGWDLFGTRGVTPNLTILSPNLVWYVQAGALVAGHVAGLAVAHERAVTIFRDRETALASQLPLLGLMVLYTVGGLWILSRG